MCIRDSLWPFDLISMSRVQVHTWRNFGENIYEDIVFTRFSGHCLRRPWPLIPKASQRIYEQKIHTLWPKTGWNSLYWVARYGVHKVFNLDVWPFDLISMTQAPIHTSPNFGETRSNTYKDSVFTRFFGSLPAMILTFTFDFLTRNLTSISANANPSVTRIG